MTLGEHLDELRGCLIRSLVALVIVCIPCIFFARYLLEVLQVIDTEQVALETNSPSSPGVIRPVGQDNYVHVIMPMFVQW